MKGRGKGIPGREVTGAKALRWECAFFEEGQLG